MSFVFLFLLTAALSARDNQAKQQTALNLICILRTNPYPSLWRFHRMTLTPYWDICDWRIRHRRAETRTLHWILLECMRHASRQLHCQQKFIPGDMLLGTRVEGQRIRVTHPDRGPLQELIFIRNYPTVRFILRVNLCWLYLAPTSSTFLRETIRIELELSTLFMLRVSSRYSAARRDCQGTTYAGDAVSKKF